MKKYILSLYALCFTLSIAAQNQDKRSLGYEVYGTYNKAIPQEQLNKAKTLSDLNPAYPSSWINKHFSVEVSVNNDGNLKSIAGKNDTLSNAQIQLLKTADLGAEISIHAKYNPKNSSESNVREINFAYSIVPTTEASFEGGYDALKDFLKVNAIDKIPADIAKKIEVSNILFTINKNGKVTDIQLDRSSGDHTTDDLLLEVVNKMPNWVPAQNEDGRRVKQTFRLSVGNMVGC